MAGMTNLRMSLRCRTAGFRTGLGSGLRRWHILGAPQAGVSGAALRFNAGSRRAGVEAIANEDTYFGGKWRLSGVRKLVRIRAFDRG
jgi:hypothetical protein